MSIRTALFALVLSTTATFAGTPSQTGAAAVELATAQPLVAPVSGTQALIIGTTEDGAVRSSTVAASADVPAFRFPATVGHVRAYATNQIAAAQTYAAQPSLFDALIPAVSYTGCGRFDSSCRSVFTSVTAGERPARVMLEEKSLAQVGPLLAAGARLSEADQRVVMQRVLAGYEVAPRSFIPVLGGVQRSTAAVIPASPLTGVDRPTMIYVGAADGMMHALCGSVKAGVCDRVGRELWAYVPRSLLGSLRTHTAVVDGSPHVVEVMGDFAHTGRRELRTIMLFTTGATSSVTALDITNPADPTIAWEYAAPGIAGTELTTGRHQLTVGPKVFAYVPTSAGVLAIDVETGRPIWQNVEKGVHTSGIAVTTTKGQASELVFGTAKGELYVLDALTGKNRRKGPAFQFSTPGHPFTHTPVLYANADGERYALAVSGGADAASTQYAVAISLSAKPNPAPLDEQSADSTRLPIVLAFDERTTSRPVVGDRELVFATPSKAYRVSFVTNTITNAQVPARASVVPTSTHVYATGLTTFGRIDGRADARVANAVVAADTDDDARWY